MHQSEAALTGKAAHVDISANKLVVANKLAAAKKSAVSNEPATANAKSAVKSAHFFMSANTPSGFVSRFDRLYTAAGNWKAYILKSAPGVAPVLLKKEGERFEESGIDAQYIHCVSDPDNVSALVLPQLKICIADGMQPHCIVPEFPGVVEDEVVLFTPDSEKLLAERDRILQFAARSASLYDRAYRFLSAALSLKSDTLRIAVECLDTEAVEKYASGLAKRLFMPRGNLGSDTERFLSGVTANGVVFFYDAIADSYSHVFSIEDEYGVGRLLLSLLREKAMAAGHSVITCKCPVGQWPEHLLIPSLSIAFVTSNSFHRTEGKVCRHINIKRFMDCDSLRLKKARVGFNRRTARELYNQAVSLLAEAKADDDIVRDCYKPSVDLEAAKEKIDSLVSGIISKTTA